MRTRKQLAANWKMNLTLNEVFELLDAWKPAFAHLVAEGSIRPTLICAPAPYLLAVGNELAGHAQMQLAAQNIHHEAAGAYTGEHSAEMVREAGASWTILGHSERRQHQAETNALLLQKVRQAFANQLKVVYCVGETLAEREANRTLEIVGSQLKEVLYALDAARMADVVVAYEPVWAIGTGRAATPETAQEVHAYIRSLLRGHFGAEVSNSCPIQYGGSVKASNAAALFSQPDIDGALVGGAALVADEFVAIARALAAA